MGKKYFQLGPQNRVFISCLQVKGTGISEISRRTGFHKSTISRELRRNAKVSTREEHLLFLEMSLTGFSKKKITERLAELKAHVAGLCIETVWTATDDQRTRDHRLAVSQQLRRRKRPETRAWVIEKRLQILSG